MYEMLKTSYNLERWEYLTTYETNSLYNHCLSSLSLNLIGRQRA